MNNHNSRDVCVNDFLLFLAGAGIGVGLGMLLAPKSGEETRQAIRGKAHEGKDYLARQSRDLTREVANRAAALADKASTLADKGRETVENQRSSVAAALDAGRQAYRETVSQTV